MVLNTQMGGFPTHPDVSRVGSRMPRIQVTTAHLGPAGSSPGLWQPCPQVVKGQGSCQGTRPPGSQPNNQP